MLCIQLDREEQRGKIEGGKIKAAKPAMTYLTVLLMVTTERHVYTSFTNHSCSPKVHCAFSRYCIFTFTYISSIIHGSIIGLRKN